MKRAIPLGAGASERDGQRLGRKMERKRWREAREILSGGVESQETIGADRSIEDEIIGDKDRRRIIAKLK